MNQPEDDQKQKLNRLMIITLLVAASTAFAIIGIGFWVYAEKRAELESPNLMYRTLTPEEYRERTPAGGD